MELIATDLAERLGRWSSGRGPLYVLLAARLRRLIDEGELPPGAPLPTDRALAPALAVGRGTVVAAYDELRLQGRIVRRQGSGTRVAGPPEAALTRGTTGASVFLHLLEPKQDVIMLACAAPDSPPPELAEAYARIAPRLAAISGDIGYHPSGHPALRRALAEHYTARGVPTQPEQILVTGGAQQALSLLARAFVRPGDHVLVEAPTYPGALEAFREEGAVVRGLPVGLAGLAAAARERRPVLAYAVPTFHNPTGAVLSALARRRLVEEAAGAGVPLIDDEVLAGLAFPGTEASPGGEAGPGGEVTPPPLAAYAPRGEAVVSVGSLSKVAWGGSRVGWVRAAAPVVARLARLRAVRDLGGDVPAQLAAAELLPRLDAVRRRRAVERRARHDRLRAELARHLPEWDVPPVAGGHTLWVRLPQGDGTSFAQAALRHGVAVLPGGGLDASGGSREFLRLHFVLPEEELSEAVRRLAAAWRAYDPSARRGGAPPTMAV
ncbi:aminotransferase-like domain-containing protein [Allostreptomyces psammosilenae]|uniref:DNA-binding transcriptional MocR family regulator n=1 Tax=Allostreptomyces psammosilenae TaxID=1892865 RepID=A0A852ZSJ5_9ACTN|nr:PLP-dependent aminotransferase family protein [Allostreptomyces psammosilenae]NYI05309.1 DNA-binding transcriptional MocR family regulator [Allostreptomyces psammosilenae]